MFRFLADKVRKGEQVAMEIPLIGTFVVRSNIVAVAFKGDLSEETKGSTAKGHFVNKLFASSVSRHNLQIHDQNNTKRNPSAGLGGAMRLSGDAEDWLKNNLNISVQDMLSRVNDKEYQFKIQSGKSL